MAKTYHNESPYYDDYNPSKGYTQILAVPGRVEQAREFTQVGTMALDFIGRLGDSMYKDGAILDGCTLSIKGKKATITSGRIYLNGLVRLVPETTLDISGAGNEVIGAEIISTIVTEVHDNTLLDPAQGYENAGQAGAHRVKETVQFSVNKENTTAVYRLVDGNLVNATNDEKNNQITETLARRTFDENGNYKVEGLGLQDRNEVKNGKILINITSGKAYIKGFEITKPASTIVELELSQSTKTVVAEPKNFTRNNKVYQLNNSPVKVINSIIAVTEVTETITRGNITGGTDYLPKNPVVSITSVTANGVTYREGTDFQLASDGIDWSLSGKEPSIGSTYQCTYRYNRKLNTNNDIVLSNDNGVSKITLTNSGAEGIVDNSRLQISYDFYLARKDLICLDKDGEPVVIQGKPDVIRLAETPLNQNDNQLVIGSVMISPNSSNLIIANFNTSRLTQAELYNLLRRIEDMEYNQAVSDLDKEAIEGEAATSLRGVYTDGFIGTTKCDISNPEFNCMIDTDKGELTLPMTQYVIKASINDTNSGNTVKRFGQVVMAPFVDEVALTQDKASDQMLVNPYAVYNPLCLVELDPPVDNWVDTSKVTINKEKTNEVTLRRWWYHRGDEWAESERQKYSALGIGEDDQNNWNNKVGKTVTTTTDTIWGDSIQYMRSIPIQIHGQNFQPNEQNIECEFNGISVPLRPAKTTTAGTKTGTVNVDANGEFWATIDVPPNQPCGSVSVVLKSALSRGEAVYRANGRKQIIQDTVLTTTTLVNTYDPLAQSFQFSEDTVLTKIDLFFATKDPSKAVTVQVRNMVNGYPGATCYATVNIPAKDIKVSENSTEATTVTFNQPVYCHADESYCFAILSDSNLYKMHVAELGKKDIVSQQFITSQPYNAGVLFSSSNAQTWTAHQATDLKFKLYKAKYTGQGQVIFSDITSQDISNLVLAAQSIDYKNKGITWEYSIDTTNVWNPIETYVERELGTKTTKLKLRATLNCSANSSPILAANTVNLVGFLPKGEGRYLSRTVTMNEPYTKLKVSYEAKVGTGNQVKVFYQHEKSINWNELTSPRVTPVNQDFSKYEYTLNTGLETVQPKTYKLKVIMSGNNPLNVPRVRKLMSILKY